jgi:excisionase family DNA binding protein
MTPDTEQQPGYLNIQDTARVLGVDRSTVRRMLRDGRLPAVELGPRTIRIPKSAIEALGNTST